MACSPPKSCSVDKWKSLRMTATRRKLDKMVKRNAELSVLFKRLYADNVLGKISIPSLEMVVQQMAAQTQVPSIDKGKHACQRVFPALFALFALAGASPPAAQKPKITRRSIAGRCGQFCRSRNVSRQGKARREYCRIVKGLDAVWAHFCPSKPCLPSSIDGIVSTEEQGGKKEQAGSGCLFFAVRSCFAPGRGITPALPAGKKAHPLRDVPFPLTYSSRFPPPAPWAARCGTREWSGT